MGVCVGSALGGVAFAESQYGRYNEAGIRGVDPILALSVFSGAGSCNVAIELDVSGPNTANSDSCASGTIALGNALSYIRRGQADAMLARGGEVPLAPLTLRAFGLLRPMARQNDPPQQACR